MQFNAHDTNRFYHKFNRGPSDACWEWKGIMMPNGYGVFPFKRAGRMYAHRVSWTINKGPIPTGLLVCHSCDNRRCVNPNHLFLGTPKDNGSDAAAKGRTCRGEKNGGAKLTTKDVLRIRSLIARGETQDSIASDYGLTRCAVALIAQGKRWKHLGPPVTRGRRTAQDSPQSITLKQSIQIQQLIADGMSANAMQKKFGYARSTISKIIHKKHWTTKS